MKEKLIAKLLNCFIATTEKNNLTMQQRNNRKSQKGVTLIELVVVTAIIAILSAVSTVGLIGYTRTARLNSAANELITTLNVAKSNALSQVKNSALCISTDVLDGYRVRINTDKLYDLRMVCASGDKIITTKTLPDNITFTSPTPVNFLFPVIKGGVVGSGTVNVSGFGKTKTVTVDSAGNIR